MTRARRRPGRRRAPLVLGGGGACAIAVGVALVLQPPELRVPDAGTGEPVVRAAPLTVAPSAPSPGPVPRSTPSGVAVSPPVHLDVPAVDVSADVVPAGVLPDGALDVPPDPRVVGWWSSGAVPGAPAGTVVLAAHVDASGVGAGPMVRLVEAPLGTEVRVGTADGDVATYAVAERRSYAKADGLPREVYRADGPHRLVLVTCGGVFDARTGHYSDNVVVVATEVAGA